MNPEKIYHVSQTQLSVVRYAGGCIYNGDYYVYNPIDDTLTREDFLKKKKKPKKNKSPEDRWPLYLKSIEEERIRERIRNDQSDPDLTGFLNDFRH